jgi:hypothetical protein
MFSYVYYGYLIYQIYNYTHQVNNVYKTYTTVINTYKWLRSPTKDYEPNLLSEDYDLCDIQKIE